MNSEKTTPDIEFANGVCKLDEDEKDDLNSALFRPCIRYNFVIFCFFLLIAVIASFILDPSLSVLVSSQKDNVFRSLLDIRDDFESKDVRI